MDKFPMEGLTTAQAIERLAHYYLDAREWRLEESELLHKYRLRLESVEEMLRELVEQLGGLQ